MEYAPAKTTKQAEIGAEASRDQDLRRFSVSDDESTVWTPSARQKAISELASWEGVKHVNRIAVPGVGIDCIHLVFRAYIAAGLLPERRLGRYDTEAGLFCESNTMEQVLLDCLHGLSKEPHDPVFGDVVIFQTGDRSAHCGFYENDHIWHSLARQCVLRSPWGLWRRKAKRLITIYQTGFRKDPQLSAKKHGR